MVLNTCKSSRNFKNYSLRRWVVNFVEVVFIIGKIHFLNFSKVNSLFYSRVMLFYTVSGASLAKTPGSQIEVRVCSGAPGAAELWHTWIGDLALEISVGAN